ncbi:N-acetylgalactosamine-4-sulfatase [Halorubrum coriense DSM 10284]|uniref:N-acetylgalactosamine-4-sulfatase n=1 Tax=Halorubrum coriense DSM 10284 TaxID=1227466 RepID=M0ED11_9EURY|nr:sulfatase-like hydrolase/transferase [Halorubrum coriense]ELZ44923.1 N-acetylgalactosamine-4-sulfatase [Halorubrum coriense DSM 10284]
MIDANNVAIFMSDSVRWDSLPESVADQGVALKTVASSLYTPTAHASMLTGLYLNNHSVRGFSDSLPSTQSTILDSFPNSGLSNVGGTFDDPVQGDFFNETIYNTLLKDYDRTSLSEIEEPFAWFMRDPGGHAPYGGWDLSLNVSESVPSFYDRCAGDENKMRDLYSKGLQDSVDRFEKYVLEPLEDRGILNDTLIIFLSDHGEQLGEYGHAGQSFPATPELVYVPSVFIHPDIEPPQDEGIFRHVDLAPTIAGLLNREKPTPVEGKNVFESSMPKQGYSLYDRPFPSFRNTFSYQIRSTWDSGGGYVLNTSSLWSKLKLTAGYLAKVPAGRELRRNLNPKGVKLLLESERTWGDPNIAKDEAIRDLRELDFNYGQKTNIEMDEDVQENLEDLGYL